MKLNPLFLTFVTIILFGCNTDLKDNTTQYVNYSGSMPPKVMRGNRNAFFHNRGGGDTTTIREKDQKNLSQKDNYLLKSFFGLQPQTT